MQLTDAARCPTPQLCGSLYLDTVIYRSCLLVFLCLWPL